MTKFGIPAVQLLVALGFHARAVMAQGNPIPDEEELEGELHTQAKSEKDELSDVQVQAEVDKALAADGSKDTCRLTLLFVMSEPSTETTAGREAWKVRVRIICIPIFMFLISHFNSLRCGLTVFKRVQMK